MHHPAKWRQFGRVGDLALVDRIIGVGLCWLRSPAGTRPLLHSFRHPLQHICCLQCATHAFPLRLAGQRVAASCTCTQPCTVGHCIVPVHIDHRLIIRGWFTVDPPPQRCPVFGSVPEERSIFAHGDGLSADAKIRQMDALLWLLGCSRIGAVHQKSPPVDPHGLGLERFSFKAGLVEQHAVVVGAAEKDGRTPLWAAIQPVDGLACLADRGLDGASLCQCPVERLAEGDRSAIGDRELHGQHCRQALFHQLLRHTCKGVAAATSRALAGVEKNQPQALLAVLQQDFETLRRHPCRLPGLVFEDQAALSLFVKIAVANEMKHMNGPLSQPGLQGRPDGRYPLQAHLMRAQASCGLLQTRPFFFHRQGRHPSRVGENSQHGQRRRQQLYGCGMGHLQIAYQRRPDRKGQKAAQLRRIEVLPGQVGQHRQPVVNAQPDSQAGFVVLGLVQTAAQAVAYSAAKCSLIELGAQGT